MKPLQGEEFCMHCNKRTQWTEDVCSGCGMTNQQVYDEQYAKHWPMIDIDLCVLAGSREVGSDTFLLGAFGGFGGTFLYAHSDLEKAKAHAKEWNNDPLTQSHLSVYRLKITLEDEMVDSE